MRAIVKGVIQREANGKRRRGRPHSNVTPHSDNITTGTGGSVEEIMRAHAGYIAIVTHCVKDTRE